MCKDINAQAGSYLQPSTDSKASQVGAPLIHLPDKGHGVWVCMPEELDHLHHITQASATMQREGFSIGCLYIAHVQGVIPLSLPEESANVRTSQIMTNIERAYMSILLEFLFGDDLGKACRDLKAIPPSCRPGRPQSAGGNGR